MTQTISWVVAIVVLWGYGFAAQEDPRPAWPIALWKGFWIGALVGIGILAVLAIGASFGMLCWMLYGAAMELLFDSRIDPCPPMPG